MRVRRRSYRTRHASHPVRPIPRVRYHLLHRVLRHGSTNDRRRTVRRRHGTQYGGRDHPPDQGEQHRPRHGGVRPGVLLLHQRAHVHGRRQRHGHASGTRQSGSGIRPISPHGYLRRGMSHHRGLPRRGRHPSQFRGRTIHGTVRPVGEGSRQPGRRFPFHDDGNSGGTGRWSQEGSHLSSSRSSSSGLARRTSPRHFRDGRHLCGSRRDEGTHPRPPHGPLQYGRCPDQPLRRGRTDQVRFQGRIRAGRGRARTLRGGRGGVRVGPRGQSPRGQFPPGHCRVRTSVRTPHRRPGRSGRRHPGRDGRTRRRGHAESRRSR
mmetsp:Transcript_8045/g.23945  ORF Transcript_8045/g.23945 Transcript_8045/m.23945 type:complete len:320 (+) Transcript_8045:793-1752(+)